MGKLIPLASAFASLESMIAANWEGEDAPVKQGRPLQGDAPVPMADRVKKHREKKSTLAKRQIAILDMETDPFDSVLRTHIKPFLAVLYSDEFEPVVIWEENHAEFVRNVIRSIEQLPGRFTIYAHNGGKFDFLFLVSGLRGDVKFKGRGIMSATIGSHELRDSAHIIPERLAAFQKEKFDYERNKPKNRNQWKKEIIEYCIADCRYTLDIVKSFVASYGFKLTIGQAAMGELRKHYSVKRISKGFDSQLRQFYFGGRVECLEGRGHFKGHYKLYDVNSMYPKAMADYQHPIGDFDDYDIRSGEPSEQTVFVDVTCANRGALIGRDADGFTTATVPYGRFKTTIHEFKTAVRLNLISDIRINCVWDCRHRTNFAEFIVPLYENRLTTKNAMDVLKKQGCQTTQEFLTLKKDDIFFKLLLNNSYGKFAINPENFKEHYLTDPDDLPPPEWFKSLEDFGDDDRALAMSPIFKSDTYAIWQKPSPSFRYQNVGVAASITGAARAMLLEGIHGAVNPIYCDTDSIICADIAGVEIHKSKLGAWDLEDEFEQVVINGKKLYAVWHKTPRLLTAEQIADGRDARYTVKSKGTARLTWQEMLDMLGGANVVKYNRAPTLTKFGTQRYQPRTIRATAKGK